MRGQLEHAWGQPGYAVLSAPDLTERLFLGVPYYSWRHDSSAVGVRRGRIVLGRATPAPCTAVGLV